MDFFIAFIAFVAAIIAVALFLSAKSQIDVMKKHISKMQNDISLLQFRINNNNSNNQNQPSAPQGQQIYNNQVPPVKPTVPQQPCYPQSSSINQPAMQSNQTFVSPAHSNQINRPQTQQPIPSNQYAPQANNNFADKNRVEKVIGKNIIAWCAAILIFIGVISFGILIYNNISETAKIITMFIVSGGLTAAGIMLSLKTKNPFTVTLTGCGLGSLYIATLITCSYFNAISDIAAFGLLLIWLAASLFISKVIDSSAISIVAHFGMFISVCFAYSCGLEDSKIILVLCYQLISSIILISGNILFSKKTYYAGLIVASAATVISSIFMLVFFMVKSSYAFTSPIVITAFSFQFITSCILTFMLSFNISKIISTDAKSIMQIINKLIWTASLFLNIFLPLIKIIGEFDISNYDVIFASSVISLAIVALHFIITFILINCKVLSETLESINAIFTSFLSAVLLMLIYFINSGRSISTQFSFFALYAIVFFVINFFVKKELYSIIGFVFLIVDGLLTVFGGYPAMIEKHGFALGLIYFIILTAIAFANYYLITEKSKSDKLMMQLFCYIFAYLSAISLFMSVNWKYNNEILLIILNILPIILFAVKYGKDFKFFKTLARVTEGIIISSDIITFLAVGASAKALSSEKEIFYIIISLLAITLAFIRVVESYRSKSREGEFLLLGLKVTVLLLSIIHCCTSVFEENFTFSIICMVIALICVASGFKLKIKSIRLYGLVVTIIFVLKLAIIDTSGEEAVLRIFSLIGGGIICFAISALYSYMNKKLDE